MAALLAGARLLLSQGIRFLPAYRLQPACAPVRRCLSMSPKFLTTSVQDETAVDLERSKPHKDPHFNPGSWGLYNIGRKATLSSRVNKRQFLESFEQFCQAGNASSSDAWLLLQACGSQMHEALPEERTVLANRVWNKLKELGVKADEYHYNMLLRKYIENEHNFSPSEFLAEMEAANIKPNLSTYELLIEAYCLKGDIEGASNILNHLKSINLPITENIFCSLITGHTKTGDMENALNILNVMKESGLIPKKGAYMALLNAYAEKGDLENMKTILNDTSLNLRSWDYLKIIYPLVKYGHSELLPEVFEHIKPEAIFTKDVSNLCLMLLAQGYADEALLVTKRLIPIWDSDRFFSFQPGNFFLRQCVNLNMPVATIKTYATELQEANIHCSPLQFALLCAFEAGNKDLALELIKTLKNENLPVKVHYFYPLFASVLDEKNFKGGLQLLKEMYEMNVNPDISLLSLYIADWFNHPETKSLLEEMEFTNDFNTIYLSALREALHNNQYYTVCNLLSSNMPLTMNRGFLKGFLRFILQPSDVTHSAKITKLLFEDRFWPQKSSHETGLEGYFLFSLIDRLGDVGIFARREQLKQYFHHLKELEITIDAENAKKIKTMLENRQGHDLIEVVEALKVKGLAQGNIEEKLERLKQTSPSVQNIRSLLNELSDSKDVQNALKLKEMYGEHFDFGMYMKVLKLCCIHNKPEEALQLKKEIDQKAFGQQPSLPKYMGLFRVLASHGFVEDAINVLKEMHEGHVYVDKESRRILSFALNRLAEKGDVDGVKQLFKHVVDLQFSEPSKDICSALVSVHLARNEFELALQTIKECDRKYKCCPMDVITLVKIVEAGDTELLTKAVDSLNEIMGERRLLHSLLFAFLENRKYEEAQKIVETPGFRAVPHLITWVLKRFSKLNMLEQMEKTVEITRDLFNCNRENMYHLLLEEYDRTNNWTKAISLWSKMKEEAAEIKEDTCQLLEEICEKNGQDINVHIPQFQKERHLLKLEIHQYLSKKVEDLCKSRMWQDAYEVFLDSEKKNQTLLKATYSRLSKVLLMNDQYEAAMKVDNIAKSHYRNYTTDNLYLDHILEMKVRQDCLKDALIVTQMMFQNGNVPRKNTLQKFLEQCALSGDLDSVIKMETMIFDFQGTNTTLEFFRQYFRLLSLFKDGKVEEATALIESLISKDPNKSIKFVANFLLKSNMTEALEKLSIVTEMFANKMSIYRPVLDLFITYVDAGKQEDAKQLLQRCSIILEQTQFIKARINKFITLQKPERIHQLLDILEDPLYKNFGYNHLMRFHITNRDFQNALKLYHRMESEDVKTADVLMKQLAVLLREANMPVPFPEHQESVTVSR